MFIHIYEYDIIGYHRYWPIPDSELPEWNVALFIAIQWCSVLVYPLIAGKT